jgi:hypothetical protein
MKEGLERARRALVEHFREDEGIGFYLPKIIVEALDVLDNEIRSLTN